MTVYLDANATEILRDGAIAAMLDSARLAGNPSSVHGPGREARRVLEAAREAIGRIWQPGLNRWYLLQGAQKPMPWPSMLLVRNDAC